MLFHSKKMAGGALLKEGKARLLTFWEGPSSQRSFKQTRCQNWEPPKYGRAETHSQPITPAPDGEKGMAANPTALQVSSLSWYDGLLLIKVLIFHAEQVLSVKIPPVVKRAGVPLSCPPRVEESPVLGRAPVVIPGRAAGVGSSFGANLWLSLPHSPCCSPDAWTLDLMQHFSSQTVFSLPNPSTVL